MKGCGGGCLERVLALVVVAIIVVVAWRFGPGLLERIPERSESTPVASSPELADAALGRFADLVEGRVDRIVLHGPELESVLRFRLDGHFPRGISEPTVVVRDGELRLGLQVALDLIPHIPELEGVRSFLPDRVPVELRGRILTLEGGTSAFLVQRIDVGGVPIPRRFHAALVEAIDPERDPELPSEAVRIPLPDGVRSVRAADDHLILEGHP